MDESRMKYPSNLNYNGKIMCEMGPRVPPLSGTSPCRISSPYFLSKGQWEHYLLTKVRGSSQLNTGLNQPLSRKLEITYCVWVRVCLQIDQMGLISQINMVAALMTNKPWHICNQHGKVAGWNLAWRIVQCSVGTTRPILPKIFTGESEICYMSFMDSMSDLSSTIISAVQCCMWILCCCGWHYNGIW